jgi:hypothetical protein
VRAICNWPDSAVSEDLLKLAESAGDEANRIRALRALARVAVLPSDRSEASKLQPMNGLAWYALGMAWQHCNEPDKVTAVIEHTLTHDPQTAQRLIRDAGRSDYAHHLG